MRIARTDDGEWRGLAGYRSQRGIVFARHDRRVQQNQPSSGKGTTAMSDSDIVQDFLVESYENLDRLDRELVDLEKNPDDREALASVVGTISTIKGTAGFLCLHKPVT